MIVGSFEIGPINDAIRRQLTPLSRTSVCAWAYSGLLTRLGLVLTGKPPLGCSLIPGINYCIVHSMCDGHANTA